ncbi:MAG: hypothetical protein Unbinned5350contig1001_38 [Prokaryotic dsDNA virus sp.]|nr:MAG: hypothetical protein Unbinned5350contig1001_38 [Prokaryotic dsDNA virus sp.]|tara:strand:- start:13718 stop:13969 length:252 start_codon:yes stop_codon:yes gene_type:complete
MKVSDILNKLIEESDFEGTKSLSEYTGVNKGFIDRARTGKNTLEKLDIVFEALTKDLTAEDFMLVRQLIRNIRLREIEREQIL